MPPTFAYENSDAVGTKYIESNTLLKLYPNPATNKVFVYYKGNYLVKVKVFNLLGEEVTSTKIMTNESMVDIS